MSFTREEIRYLELHRSDIAYLAHEQLSGETRRVDLLARDSALRARYGTFGRAMAEAAEAQVISLRGKKLPTSWLADKDAAQQATAYAVARMRARRIARTLGSGAAVHDVTCSVGGEALALHSMGLHYLGSDLDVSRLLMARINLSETPDTLLFCADALRVTSQADVLLADPARRTGGRRVLRPELLSPPVPELVARHSGRPLAIKCAPGIDYSEWNGLASVVSVAGGVKETCLYTPDLAQGERREAVVLDGAGNVVDRLTDSTRGGTDKELVAPPGRYILDPDGAVIRAGLVRQFAQREGLWLVDPRIAYLTGDRIPPGYTGFPIVEQVSLKKIARTLHNYDVGSVEILCRGVEVNPDALRSRWKLTGSQVMAVVIMRMGRGATAFVCGPRTAENTGDRGHTREPGKNTIDPEGERRHDRSNE